ncbi:MAG: hypothetical protein A3F18_01470 [Legionellales bacterium RIFCSPHIGHO2_12_FULL_37_14]|nr:MAG: hypothetical protein A3F18_01470 [Legionellales bacterium RIFCSPHIGHO2_12_FULL_37_14]
MVNLATEKAKFKWLCRRGMLELDILLARFCDQKLNTLSQQDLQKLTKLLQASDPELLNWLTGSSKPNDEESLNVVNWIRSYLELK